MLRFPIVLVLCSFSSVVVADAVAESLAVKRPHGVSAPASALLPVAQVPPLSKAQAYRAGINVSEFLVSEKYDGARVWWNGEQLLSRNGNVYHAPEWFTNALPRQVLDGELWVGRGQFQQLMQTIRDRVPDDHAWRSVRFMVFDAPRLAGSFEQRQRGLAQILAGQHADWVEQVVQRRVSSSTELQDLLLDITTQGAEGLILQRANMEYMPARHTGYLKLKLYDDAEAVVVGYKPGKGKYTGMTGSLVVQSANGKRFRLGSGLTDTDRKAPPPIGTMVTYRFQGLTNSGKPRFARFLRVRPSE